MAASRSSIRSRTRLLHQQRTQASRKKDFAKVAARQGPIPWLVAGRGTARAFSLSTTGVCQREGLGAFDHVCSGRGVGLVGDGEAESDEEPPFLA